MAGDDNFRSQGHDEEARGKEQQSDAEFSRNRRVEVASGEAHPERGHNRRKGNNENGAKGLEPSGWDERAEKFAVCMSFSKEIEGGTDLFEAGPKQRGSDKENKNKADAPFLIGVEFGKEKKEDEVEQGGCNNEIAQPESEFGRIKFDDSSEGQNQK